jgi:hypothetical protein
MSTLNNKYEYQLYLVMSSKCQHCVKLKNNYLGKIRSGIETNFPNVQFIPIELENMSDKIPSQYPNGLSVYVKWFPTFVFTSTAEVEKSKSLGNIPFKASVLNGDYIDNRLSYRNEFPMNDTGVLDWCQREINNYKGNKRVLNETESFIPTTVCTKKFKPRSNV